MRYKIGIQWCTDALDTGVWIRQPKERSVKGKNTPWITIFMRPGKDKK